jgi:hypothetical protein
VCRSSRVQQWAPECCQVSTPTQAGCSRLQHPRPPEAILIRAWPHLAGFAEDVGEQAKIDFVCAVATSRENCATRSLTQRGLLPVDAAAATSEFPSFVALAISAWRVVSCQCGRRVMGTSACWTPHLAINRVAITGVSELRKDRKFSGACFGCCHCVRDLYARHAVELLSFNEAGMHRVLRCASLRMVSKAPICRICTCVSWVRCFVRSLLCLCLREWCLVVPNPT